MNLSPDLHKSITEEIRQNTAEIKTAVRVVNEDHLNKKLQSLKNEDYPLLVAVIPSMAQEGSDFDSSTWNNVLLWFVLKKVHYAGRKPDEEDSDFELTFQAAKAMIQYIENQHRQGCGIFQKLKPGFSVGPEYSYAGCDGWSITLTLKT